MWGPTRKHDDRWHRHKLYAWHQVIRGLRGQFGCCTLPHPREQNLGPELATEAVQVCRTRCPLFLFFRLFLELTLLAPLLRRFVDLCCSSLCGRTCRLAAARYRWKANSLFYSWKKEPHPPFISLQLGFVSAGLKALEVQVGSALQLIAVGRSALLLSEDPMMFYICLISFGRKAVRLTFRKRWAKQENEYKIASTGEK